MSTGRKGLSEITKPERVYATNEHTNRAKGKERNEEKNLQQVDGTEKWKSCTRFFFFSRTFLVIEQK